MRHTQLISICFLICLACQNTDPVVDPSSLIPIETSFKVDSVAYSVGSAQFYYKIEINGGVPPYNIQWISPATNDGYGPFMDSLTYAFDFEAVITDEQKLENSVSYSFDYRDSLIGDYICAYREGEYGTCFPNPNSISEERTISVSKVGKDNLSVLGFSFLLDPSWDFLENQYQGYHTFYVGFTPSESSITVGFIDGSVGCGTSFEYRGTKVK